MDWCVIMYYYCCTERPDGLLLLRVIMHRDLTDDDILVKMFLWVLFMNGVAPWSKLFDHKEQEND